MRRKNAGRPDHMTMSGLCSSFNLWSRHFYVVKRNRRQYRSLKCWHLAVNKYHKYCELVPVNSGSALKLRPSTRHTLTHSLDAVQELTSLFVCVCVFPSKRLQNISNVRKPLLPFHENFENTEVFYSDLHHNRFITSIYATKEKK